MAQLSTIEPCHEIMVLFVLRKLILQTHICSHSVGLVVWDLVGPFVYFHTSCIRAVSPEPLLVAYAISTIISWVGSLNVLFYNINCHLTIKVNTRQSLMLKVFVIFNVSIGDVIKSWYTLASMALMGMTLVISCKPVYMAKYSLSWKRLWTNKQTFICTCRLYNLKMWYSEMCYKEIQM